MDKEFLFFIIELVTVIGSFLFGRYVMPRYKTTIQQHITEFQVLLNYAESFVAYAKQFLTSYSGEEKMNAVVKKLKEICDSKGLDVDEETLKAIGQKAYNSMVAGENNNPNIIIENALDLIKDNITKSEVE